MIIRVKSTFITALRYDSGAEVLTVYINGRPYPYVGVDRHRVRRFRLHRSPGRYYRNCIKGRFPRLDLHPELRPQLTGD